MQEFVNQARDKTYQHWAAASWAERGRGEAQRPLTVTAARGHDDARHDRDASQG